MPFSTTPQTPPEGHHPHPLCVGLRCLAGVLAGIALFMTVAILLNCATPQGAQIMMRSWVVMSFVVLFPLLNAAGFWFVAEYMEYHTWLVLEKREARYPLPPEY